MEGDHDTDDGGRQQADRDIDVDYLPYSVIAIGGGTNFADFAVMCCGIYMHVEVRSEDLAESEDEPAPLKDQFELYMKKAFKEEDYDAEESLHEWLLGPCIPQIRPFIDHEKWRARLTTLDGYYHATTFMFTLKNVNGRLEAIREYDNTSFHGNLLPSIPTSDPIVSSALQHQVPLISGSQLIIIREPFKDEVEVSDWEFNDLPKVVEKDGRRYEFHSASDKRPFARTLECLIRIQQRCPDTHAPKIAGLVQWDEDSSIGGLLVDHIPKTTPLDFVMNYGCTLEQRKKWMEEIRSTVEALHGADIVWGQAAPENIMIDSSSQAWAVNFENGWRPDWVDRELAGTAAGDLQSLARIEKYLGL